jgi:hypothetical protein
MSKISPDSRLHDHWGNRQPFCLKDQRIDPVASSPSPFSDALLYRLNDGEPHGVAWQ